MGKRNPGIHWTALFWSGLHAGHQQRKPWVHRAHANSVPTALVWSGLHAGHHQRKPWVHRAHANSVPNAPFWSELRAWHRKRRRCSLRRRR